MRIAALILGLLGGIAGLFASGFAMFVGGVGSAFAVEGAETVTGLGLAAIPLAILGMVGGAIAITRPKIAGILMLISAVGGLICISMVYVIPFLLLLVGAILALIGQKELALKMK